MKEAIWTSSSLVSRSSFESRRSRSRMPRNTRSAGCCGRCVHAGCWTGRASGCDCTGGGSTRRMRAAQLGSQQLHRPRRATTAGARTPRIVASSRIRRRAPWRRILASVLGWAPNATKGVPLVGAETCPRACDLSRGVETDDASGTIVFRLRGPDAEFLRTLTFVAPIPRGTPDPDAGRRPLPSTGPYMVASFAPDLALTLARNPTSVHGRASPAPTGSPTRSSSASPASRERSARSRRAASTSPR